MAVQAVEFEIKLLEEEIDELLVSTKELDADNPLVHQLMQAQELQLSYSKASWELEEAYREQQAGVINFPTYEKLVDGLKTRKK